MGPEMRLDYLSLSTEGKTYAGRSVRMTYAIYMGSTACECSNLLLTKLSESLCSLTRASCLAFASLLPLLYFSVSLSLVSGIHHKRCIGIAAEPPPPSIDTLHLLWDKGCYSVGLFDFCHPLAWLPSLAIICQAVGALSCRDGTFACILMYAMTYYMMLLFFYMTYAILT